MLASTASWSTEDLRGFLPFLRPPPFSASGPNTLGRSPVAGPIAPLGRPVWLGLPPGGRGPPPDGRGPPLEGRCPAELGELELNTGVGRLNRGTLPPGGATGRGIRVGIRGGGPEGAGGVEDTGADGRGGGETTGSAGSGRKGVGRFSTTGGTTVSSGVS